MRLVTYKAQDGWRPGVVIGSSIVDVRSLANGLDLTEPALSSVRKLLATGADGLSAVAEAAKEAESSIELDAVQIGPPVPDPQKIICLGLNYLDHAKESGLTAPSVPMFFAKFANSLVGPTDPVQPPATTAKVDYEAELAVVIGRRCRGVTPAEALDYVAGATAFNDVSARDLQMANILWTGGKAIDTFGPCGPALVTLDELGDLQDLGIRTRVNGETVQDGSTASMIFGVAETVAFLSGIMTLEPGDIVATGTPAGVGQSRTPPLFLATGDIVEVEIDGIGTLRNEMIAPDDEPMPSVERPHETDLPPLKA